MDAILHDDVQIRGGVTVDVSDQERLIDEGDTDDLQIGGYDFGSHCHPQITPPHDNSAQRTLMITSIITFVFIIGEVVGGKIAGSLAIMTDAAHMLSDLGSFMISIIALRISKRAPSRRMSFGYHRAEILGAVVSILVIWVLTGILVYLAVQRLVHDDYDIEPNVMVITAACGVFFNIVMGLVLHQGGHGHSHGGLPHSHGHSHADSHSQENGHAHSHSQQPHSHNSGPAEPKGTLARNRTVNLKAYPKEETSNVNKQKNINVRAAFVHVLGDLFQSVGVLVAALIIKFAGKDYKMADPICTFLFSILVLITTVTVLTDAVRVLMEGTPQDVKYGEVKANLEAIEGVRQAHSLHVWSLTMDKAALAVHLAVDSSADPLTVMSRASRMMRFKYNLAFTTIQVEPYDRSVMASCKHCIGPS